ncbi:MAG TPA: TrmH family RNA methyltransferase, partial [Sphingomonadales bacterium]|nr:TrmH family RNA methyltransferase [Sphingomonadales bacterium]
MELALFQPDIPQNTGTLIRLCACLAIPVHVIEPCGFAFSEKGFRRAGLDYVDLADIRRHASWARFNVWRKKDKRRLVLLSTKARAPYTGFGF